MDLMASLMITAIVYLFVPVILLIAPITDRTWSLSTIKKIVIINGVCCWLLFSIVSIEAGGNGAGPAVFFWSWVAYKMLKKKLVTTTKKDTNKDTSFSISSENETPVRYGKLAISGDDVRLEVNRSEEKADDTCDDVEKLRREIDHVLAEQYQAAARGDTALAQQLFDRYISLLTRLETAEKNKEEKNKDEAHHE